MALGYDGKLYILAFDHRGSFTKRFGIEDPASIVVVPLSRGGTPPSLGVVEAPPASRVAWANSFVLGRSHAAKTATPRTAPARRTHSA